MDVIVRETVDGVGVGIEVEDGVETDDGVLELDDELDGDEGVGAETDDGVRLAYGDGDDRTMDGRVRVGVLEDAVTSLSVTDDSE